MSQLQPRPRSRWRRRWRWTLVLPACLVLIGYGCADTLVLSSNNEVIDPRGAKQKLIEVNHRVVECWITKSPGAAGHEPQALVLYFVGKGDRADRWISAVAGSWGDKPVEMWGMNYPGSGGSQGPPHLADVGADALAVFDAVHKEAGSRPVFLQAGSFGTTAALCVAAHRDVAGLILQNPPALRQLIMGQYGWWNLWLVAIPVSLQIPADLDSIANARHCSAPAIFLSAGADDVIAPRYHRMVIDAYAGHKHVIDIPGAKHNDPLPREAAADLVKDRDELWNAAIK